MILNMTLPRVSSTARTRTLMSLIGACLISSAVAGGQSPLQPVPALPASAAGTSWKSAAGLGVKAAPAPQASAAAAASAASVSSAAIPALPPLSAGSQTQVSTSQTTVTTVGTGTATGIAAAPVLTETQWKTLTDACSAAHLALSLPGNSTLADLQAYSDVHLAMAQLRAAGWSSTQSGALYIPNAPLQFLIVESLNVGADLNPGGCLRMTMSAYKVPFVSPKPGEAPVGVNDNSAAPSTGAASSEMPALRSSGSAPMPTPVTTPR